MSLTAQDLATLQNAPVSSYRAGRLRPYGMVDNTGALTPLGSQIAFHAPSRTRHVEVHVLAILKNAVEEPVDPHHHFGALSRFEEFVDAAVEWGLIDENEKNHVPTTFGRWFYDFWRLDELPESRANHWRLSPQLAVVLRLLDGERL